MLIPHPLLGLRDTLASALPANGLQLMGRSFKDPRPRGPNTRASDAELNDGSASAARTTSARSVLMRGR